MHESIRTDIYYEDKKALFYRSWIFEILNLVSFERTLFKENSFKHKLKIFILFMSISVYMSNIGVLDFYQYLRGQINKIILQKYYFIHSV